MLRRRRVVLLSIDWVGFSRWVNRATIGSDYFVSIWLGFLDLWALRIRIVFLHFGLETDWSTIMLSLVTGIAVIGVIGINGIGCMRLVYVYGVRCVLQRDHHLLLLLLRVVWVFIRIHSSHRFSRFSTLVLRVCHTRNKWMIWRNWAFNDVLEYRQKIPVIVDKS